jgi:hypothetical protein
VFDILKKFYLQPFKKILKIVNEVISSDKGENIRVLEHLLSYAEYQFGKEVTGMDYRERGNGECISNWCVDVIAMNGIICAFADSCQKNSASFFNYVWDESSVPRTIAKPSKSLVDILQETQMMGLFTIV